MSSGSTPVNEIPYDSNSFTRFNTGVMATNSSDYI